MQEQPKRGRGRPPTIGETKSVLCSAYVTPSEMAVIRDAAQMCGLSLSDFVRNALAREIARTRRNGGRSGISVLA